MPRDSYSVHQSAETPTFGCNLRAIQNEGMAEANDDKRTRHVDESRQPIWYSQPNAPAVRNGSRRLVNEQRQPVERTDDASQNLGRLIGKQSQRWRLSRQGDQPLRRRLANPAQTDRIGYPTFRRALHRSEGSSPGKVCRTAPASWRAWSSGNWARHTATVRQPANAANKPDTLAISADLYWRS